MAARIHTGSQRSRKDISFITRGCSTSLVVVLMRGAEPSIDGYRCERYASHR